MVVTGYILTFVGSIACLVGQIMLLTVAYKRGLGIFLGCLLCGPFGWLVLLAVDFATAMRPVAITVTGLLLAGFGAWMAGIEIG